MGKTKEVIKLLVFKRCEDCTFHMAIWWKEQVELDVDGKWKDGAPTCVCANNRCWRKGGITWGRDSPVLCRAHKGNSRRTFRGPYPKWCPLVEGANRREVGGFYGRNVVVPDDEWLRRKEDSPGLRLPEIVHED